MTSPTPGIAPLETTLANKVVALPTLEPPAPKRSITDLEIAGEHGRMFSERLFGQVSVVRHVSLDDHVNTLHDLRGTTNTSMTEKLS